MKFTLASIFLTCVVFVSIGGINPPVAFAKTHAAVSHSSGKKSGVTQNLKSKLSVKSSKSTKKSTSKKAKAKAKKSKKISRKGTSKRLCGANCALIDPNNPPGGSR